MRNEVVDFSLTYIMDNGVLMVRQGESTDVKEYMNGTKVIGRFVRSLGIADLRLSPSHSWRHRIKTLGRRHGLAKDLLEAITGHGQKSVADSYGEFPMEALFRELKKIPALDLKVTKIPDQR